MTKIVWIFVAFVTGNGYTGGPVIVDNIASLRNCSALGRTVAHHFAIHDSEWHCYAVRKVTP